MVEPCCAVKYYSDIEICIKELDTEEEEKQREIEREKIEDFGPTWYGKLRKKLWDLFEYPQTSKGAKVCDIFYRYYQLYTDYTLHSEKLNTNWMRIIHSTVHSVQMADS